MKVPLDATKKVIKDKILWDIVDVEFLIDKKIDFEIDWIKIVPAKSESWRYTLFEAYTIIMAENILTKHKLSDLDWDKFALWKVIREEFIEALVEATNEWQSVFQAFIDRPKAKREYKKKTNKVDSELEEFVNSKEKKQKKTTTKKEVKKDIVWEEWEKEIKRAVQTIWWGEPMNVAVPQKISDPYIESMKKKKSSVKIKKKKKNYTIK